VGEFQSYYWNIGDLDSTDARDAEVLIRSRELSDVLAAFQRLLASEHTAARGVALDHYVLAEARGRFGLRNPFAKFADTTLNVARTELGRAAVTSTSPNNNVTIGANHASALGALAHLGDATDLGAIARFLESSQSLNVLETACMAADHCVRTADAAMAREIGDRLGAIVQDERLDDEVRIRAISALRNNNPALDQDAVLVQVMRHAPFPLAARAAWNLAIRNPGNPDLRQAVANWPEDAPYPAGEVRDLLKQRR
jgi:hypothetical protein